MNNNFEPVPLRKHLLTWSKSASTARRLRSAVQNAEAGTATANPLPLPPETEKAPAVERCNWALKQLAHARQSLAEAKNEQARAEAWKKRFEKAREERQAAENARARKRATKLLAAAAVIGLLVVGAGVLWWQRRPPSIAGADVEQRITKALNERGFTPTSIHFDVGAAINYRAPVRAIVSAKLDRPLLMTIPTEPYLQSEFKWDGRASKRISELTAGNGLDRVRELAGLPSGTLDASKVTLLKTASPAGTAVSGSASLVASRINGGWSLSDATVALLPMRPDGKPRQAYSGTVFEIEREDDRARLRALVEDQANIVAKLEKARDAYTAETMAQHRKQEESLLGIFRPGSIFTGTVAGRTPAERKAIHLELLEAAGGFGIHPVKALFHNDGGWGDGRVFEGIWKFDPGHARFQLSLASGTDQMVRNGGPVLGEPRLVKLELGIEAEKLTGELDTIACQLTRVADGDAERFKREASPDYFGLMDAIAPGTIYQGKVPVAGGAGDKIYLQFTRVEKNGATVEALVQDPDHEAWQFKVSGALIGNRYREAQWPIRLAVVRPALSPGISAKALIMQFGAVALRIENSRLISDYRGQPFHFEPVPREEALQRLQGAALRRKTLAALTQPGAALAGETVNPQKDVRTPVRLRVINANATDGSITLRLESGQLPGVFRNLVGKVFEDAGALNLSFDVRPGEYNVDRRAVEPFFKGGRDTIVLALEGGRLSGQDGHLWSFEFKTQ